MRPGWQSLFKLLDTIESGQALWAGALSLKNNGWFYIVQTLKI